MEMATERSQQRVGGVFGYVGGGQSASLGVDLVNEPNALVFGQLFSDIGVIKEIKRGEIGDVLLGAVVLDVAEVTAADYIAGVSAICHAGAFALAVGAAKPCVLKPHLSCGGECEQ